MQMYTTPVTEPLVRVMLEGENKNQLQFYADNLAMLIENRLR